MDTTTIPTAQKKIVIVEDDTFLAGMYSTRLSTEGYTVLMASDGQVGLDMITKEKPDIILLDIILPEMDGFTVLQKIKSQESTKNTPVILLTNLGQKADVERGMELGASDYLIKAHFTPSEVVAKIKALIG